MRDSVSFESLQAFKHTVINVDLTKFWTCFYFYVGSRAAACVSCQEPCCPAHWFWYTVVSKCLFLSCWANKWFDLIDLNYGWALTEMLQLMGLAVYNSIILDIHFPPICYRKLLSPAVVPYNVPKATVGVTKVTLADLAHVFPVRSQFSYRQERLIVIWEFLMVSETPC